MKTKFGATVLAAAFLAALVIPWTVLAGGGGGGKGGAGAGKMGGESIRTQTQIQNQTRGMEQIQKGSGTGPAATTTESAVSATGGKTKKGNAYGPGDGTGNIATGVDPPKDGTGYGAPANR